VYQGSLNFIIYFYFPISRFGGRAWGYGPKAWNLSCLKTPATGRKWPENEKRRRKIKKEFSSVATYQSPDYWNWRNM